MNPRTALIAFLLPVTLAAQNPFAGNAKEADVGRATFRIYCAPCHGIQAKGGRGPDLTLGVYNAGDKEEDLFRVIANGVGGTEMPGFGSRMSDENVWRIVAYIRSSTARNETPLQGDAGAGEKLFWGQGNCGACHRARSRGGPMGPALSRIGRQRSVAYLRQSLVDPGADLTPGFYKITVVTKQGQTISGAQRGFDNFTVQLMTVDGKLHSFQKDELASSKREYVSLMPSYKSWDDARLNDLLAFLISLRGEN